MPDVVTCILENNDFILILKRSNKVSTYKGLWGGVAGFIEENEEDYVTAIKEIKEEVGLNKEDVVFIKKADFIKFSDCYQDVTYDWVVHPFLFKVKNRNSIKIDWEHTEFKWIDPKEIRNYSTVPHFNDVVEKFFL